MARDPHYLLQTRLRQVLTASGVSEAVTYITVSGTMLSTFAIDEGEVGVLTPRPLRLASQADQPPKCRSSLF